MDEAYIFEGEETREFKSPNLMAERKRRKKLHDRFLALRSLVPIITKMTREATIQDAITYIETLKADVDLLTQELLELEASSPLFSEETTEPLMTITTDHPQVDASEDVKPTILGDVVEVSKISEKKMWIKITMKKKPGQFSRLMEAIIHLGFELTETTLTTCKGLMLVSSFVQYTYDKLTVAETKQRLLQIVGGI
ncbi:basic helix-loop-helix (bHLH) DNA-binding superfamily protein [Euphorbia peplus]|nr:basic helix-loop-helix (bHLH) DNA-binding superfamily protein [Euphorbia peplus]